MSDFDSATGAALVVGGSGGLGLAIVRMLASRGADLAVTYHSRPEAGDAAAESARGWGVRDSAFALDVSSDTDAAAAVARVAEEFVASIRWSTRPAGRPARTCR